MIFKVMGSKLHLPTQIVLFSGALLILVGIFAAMAQLLGELQLFGLKVPVTSEPGSRSAEVQQKFKVSTHYVGVELIVIGAVLELAALFGSRLFL